MNPSRITQLEKFLEQDPNDSFVQYALATEHVNLGDDESALSYFKKILAHDPDYTGMYYHLGKLYQRRQQNDLAEQTFLEGMKRTLGKDAHTHRELQEALNQLLFEEEK